MASKKLNRISSLLLISLLVINISSVLQAEYQSYAEAEKIVLELEDQGQYDQAITILEGIFGKFPQEQYILTKELVYLYKQTGQFEKCLETWKNGHEQGYFYFINLRSPRYEDFIDLEGIKQIELCDMELRDSANLASQTIYEIQLPQNYSDTKTYPLFIVLHGGGRSLIKSRQVWQSKILSQEYIVVYLQSYLHYEMDTYGWPVGDVRIDEDLKNIYQEIVAKYPINQSEISVGGMSNGGSYAIHLVINNILPISRFIGVCPGKPRDFDEVKVKAAVDRNVKGYILSGENDYFLDRQRTMAEIFNAAGFPHEFVVIPEMGHQYPDDFSERLDSALKYFKSK